MTLDTLWVDIGFVLRARVWKKLQSIRSVCLLVNQPRETGFVAVTVRSLLLEEELEL